MALATPQPSTGPSPAQPVADPEWICLSDGLTLEHVMSRTPESPLQRLGRIPECSTTTTAPRGRELQAKIEPIGIQPSLKSPERRRQAFAVSHLGIVSSFGDEHLGSRNLACSPIGRHLRTCCTCLMKRRASRSMRAGGARLSFSP